MERGVSALKFGVLGDELYLSLQPKPGQFVILTSDKLGIPDIITQLELALGKKLPEVAAEEFRSMRLKK